MQAALRLWPEVFGSASAEQEKQRVLEQMHVVRPVIETGSVSVRCEQVVVLMHHLDMMHVQEAAAAV